MFTAIAQTAIHVCVGGANLQRKLSQSDYLRKLFLSANQAENNHPAKKKRNKELKSSSSRSFPDSELQANQPASSKMNRPLINTLAILVIFAAAHEVKSAPLENETQERTNVCGGVSGESQRAVVYFSTAFGALICCNYASLQ